ncbi:MAG TPA: LPXTG cell wall anchor domain-containing protein, partial [Thermoanaerobaculia bacterium]|nr:LPXTG cell wall anchor domain-containing protein [Thermoanaerobaculia bacterium]
GTDHAMANDTNDTMANDTTTSATADDNSLPQTASSEPAVFVFGLVALGAAAFLMRQRTTQ